MQSKRRTQQFVAAFVISGIVIAALCGFILVDLSTERYLPGQIGPLFAVEEIDAKGLKVALLGQRYTFDASALEGALDVVWRNRGLLPTGQRLAGCATTQAYLALRDYAEQEQEPEEPW